MKNLACGILLVIFLGCQINENFGKLTYLAELPRDLNEVSGIEILPDSKLIWMHNDSGNDSKIYGVSKNGKIRKEITFDVENHDWEDITSDEKGNLYIGDFGNNRNKRKNLRIYKITANFTNKHSASIETIAFTYENQQDFPPKSEQLFFDAEAFFYFKNHFYIFTKSKVKNRYGQTYMYKLPATPGKHVARLVGEYYNGNSSYSWITSADITDDGSKVVLLSEKNVLIFSDFEGDAFLSGKVITKLFKHVSQKEGVCFKDNNTIYITDEKSRLKGRNLYEFSIKE